MSAALIVEAIDVSAKSRFSSGAYLEDCSPDQLVLDRLEHSFHHCIIVTISLAAHRGDDLVRLPQPLIVMRTRLTAAVGMLINPY